MSKMSKKTIRIELGDRSYDVVVGAGVMSDLGAAATAVGDVTAAVVITDSTVGELYGAAAVGSLESAGLAATLIDFPAGEANKNLTTCGHLYDELFAVAPAVDRKTLIVALGGGVPGDTAGFIAATALRGLRWLQCPTTLLADVDASVGGKTGVDHPAGKNLIGAFYQPKGVLIDVESLRTLPAEELRSGLAECVKHAVIRDGELLEFIESNVDAIAACDEGVMTDLIARNVSIKAAVVSGDERESGRRAHLNFGHTIGHAIEAFVGFGEMSHGQAVSLGMVAACRMATERGLIDESLAERIDALLKAIGLPTRRAGLDVDEIWRIMQHDKKAIAGRVRMVLPVRLGEVEIFDDTTVEAVHSAVAALAE